MSNEVTMNQVYVSGGRKKEREMVEKVVVWTIKTYATYAYFVY